MADKYNAEKSDHRIAVVTFGTNASTLMDWTLVTPAETDTAESPSGETALKAKINGLPSEPEGATNVADGMRSAQALMQGDSGYTGTNTKRQKVVILFTDGVPTKQSDFDTTVANGAIQSAKALKDAGATVYSVGIFNGANPEQLYGDSGFKYNSNGQVGSYWASYSWWGIGDVKNYDIPAGDRHPAVRFQLHRHRQLWLADHQKFCPRAVQLLPDGERFRLAEQDLYHDQREHRQRQY